MREELADKITEVFCEAVGIDKPVFTPRENFLTVADQMIAIFQPYLDQQVAEAVKKERDEVKAFIVYSMKCTDDAKNEQMMRQPSDKTSEKMFNGKLNAIQGVLDILVKHWSVISKDNFNLKEN